MPSHPELQKRAAAFLSRAIPSELHPQYVSGSLADIIVTRCAQAQPIDPELCEIAEIPFSSMTTPSPKPGRQN